MSAEIKALKMFLTISITDMGKMEGYPHSSTIQLSISVDHMCLALYVGLPVGAVEAMYDKAQTYKINLKGASYNLSSWPKPYCSYSLEL